ncbi:MAG: 2Fe-2S iron-sulfur cluster binding domain-containing protein, partial [Vallitaleaceae bacterium]|nr:2Fe-2S iron-sulfur cluster binding domain-containing protein [Vallitaleaceae bacterium]
MRIELAFDCNKKETLEAIQCYENTPSYRIYEDLYDEILTENASILKPIGYYVMTDQQDADVVVNYEEVVCCIVTLGKAVDEKMHAYFEVDDYMKGVMMSSIADGALFRASAQLYHHVFEEVKKKGMMMTQRKEPGTSDIHVTAQKWILETINAVEQIEITITSGFMLNPTKSMGYFYGAGKSLAYTPVDHDCSLCDHIHCLHRKVYITVKTDEGEQVIRVKNKSNLLDVLREYNLPIQADCSGNQTCGQCKVKVVSKALTLSPEEKAFLTDAEIANGMVLACFQKVEADVVIEIKSQQAKILSDFDFPTIRKRKYEIKQIEGLSKSPEHNESLTDLIHQLTGKQYHYTLPVLRQLSNLIMKKSFFALIKDEEKVMKIQPESNSFYGLGIDIGTTTVAIALVNLIEEKVISIYKCMNPQKAYGADVISRIQYANEHQGGVLTNIIQEALLKGISHLMDTYQVSKDQIVEIAIAGNTTMQYLLTGINPKSLAASPFLTTHLEQIILSFEELFGDTRLSCEVVIMPGISAYIGADILAGLYTTDLNELEGNYLFIDIGT